MKIREVLRESSASLPLLTAIELLRGKADEDGGALELNTNSLIQLVKNTGAPFDYDALVDAYESDPAVKDHIKSFNKDTVTLAGDNNDVSDTKGDDRTVSKMARRALKKRS